MDHNRASTYRRCLVVKFFVLDSVEGASLTSSSCRNEKFGHSQRTRKAEREREREREREYSSRNSRWIQGAARNARFACSNIARETRASERRGKQVIWTAATRIRESVREEGDHAECDIQVPISCELAGAERDILGFSLTSDFRERSSAVRTRSRKIRIGCAAGPFVSFSIFMNGGENTGVEWSADASGDINTSSKLAARARARGSKSRHAISRDALSRGDNGESNEIYVFHVWNIYAYMNLCT